MCLNKILTLSLAAAIFAGSFEIAARAATLSWDADGVSPVNSGSGTWDTSSALWTGDAGASYVAWNNNGQVSGTPDSASIGGNSNTITLGDAIIGNGITFTGSSNTLDLNGLDLTLSGTLNGHNGNTVTNLSAAPATITASTFIGGLGGPNLAGNLNVTKIGSSNWSHTNSHSFTGLLTLKGSGTTTVFNDSGL